MSYMPTGSKNPDEGRRYSVRLPLFYTGHDDHSPETVGIFTGSILKLVTNDKYCEEEIVEVKQGDDGLFYIDIDNGECGYDSIEGLFSSGVYRIYVIGTVQEDPELVGKSPQGGSEQ